MRILVRARQILAACLAFLVIGNSRTNAASFEQVVDDVDGTGLPQRYGAPRARADSMPAIIIIVVAFKKGREIADPLCRVRVEIEIDGNLAVDLAVACIGGKRGQHVVEIEIV